MIKTVSLAAILFFGLNVAFAQKFGYIDSEYILSKMPEYAKAQNEIEQFSAAWQKEIEDMQHKVDGLYSMYQAEQVLLTEEMRQERQAEIKKKETELKAYQKKVFGFGGLYFLKKQELIKPLQDKVFDAVSKVSKANRLA
ncbi:MAG: OmpH family outer membrane protein, partial [Bacteroidetes bacterium]|nr:OmpH family outer membrane protein [Bacteroidota bacterium]